MKKSVHEKKTWCMEHTSSAFLLGALKFFYELSSHETLEEGESTRWIYDLWVW